MNYPQMRQNNQHTVYSQPMLSLGVPAYQCRINSEIRDCPSPTTSLALPKMMLPYSDLPKMSLPYTVLTAKHNNDKQVKAKQNKTQQRKAKQSRDKQSKAKQRKTQ